MIFKYIFHLILPSSLGTCMNNPSVSDNEHFLGLSQEKDLCRLLNSERTKEDFESIPKWVSGFDLKGDVNQILKLDNLLL